MKAIIPALVVTAMLLCSSAKADIVGEMGHYFFDGPVGPGAVVTLVPQASNVNGAVLRTCTGASAVGGGVYVIVDKNTPNDASIGSFRAVFAVASPAGTSQASYGTMPFQMNVPAGYGIFIVGHTTGGGMLCTWDVLG